MKELIKVTKSENGNSVVSARELCEFLEVKSDFSTWCKRMFDYGFEDGSDYTLLKIGERNAHNKTDYALTIDTAKEISMLQRNEKGKKARKYFIECEKKLNKPVSVLDMLKTAVKELEQKNNKIQGLEQALDISEQWISILRASKDYKVKETTFDWRKLKKYSIENGIEVKREKCPRFQWKNLYHISVFSKCYPEIGINLLSE